MTENREGFDLNRLDQQIEYPAGSLDAQASQLVEDLHQIYQASPADSRANAESLRRVQQRLQARFAPQETKVVSLRALPTRQERKSFMQENNSERKSGWKRVSRTFNTLAAVLVVAILIGSAVTLVNLRNHAQSTQVGTAQTATPTPTPQVNHDCSQTFTQDNGLYPDHGEHAVCEQGLEVALQGTAKMSGRTLTLVSAYADTNRLLIAYTVSNLSVKDLSQSWELPGIDQLLVQDPAETLRLGQQWRQDEWFIGGGYAYDAQKNQITFLQTFPMQDVSSGVTSIKVTANFFAPVGASAGNPAPTGIDSETFTFTVPLHTERRVATPNQSMVINGHRLTLTKVVVTPSATALYVKTDQALTPSPAANEEEQWPSATINGISNVDGAFTTNGIVNGKWDPVTGFSLGVLEDCMNQPTNWTMMLHSSGQPIGNGSGSIQFTVPPAA